MTEMNVKLKKEDRIVCDAWYGLFFVIEIIFLENGKRLCYNFKDISQTVKKVEIAY